MASVVDKPKESNQEDLLDIEKYTDGLINFIKTSQTPITIGVQGEWGSGKTSLLNTIKEELCSNDAKHHSIWLNTWEYSLLSTPDETLVKIISGLVTQVGQLTKDKNSDRNKKLISATTTLLKHSSQLFGGIIGAGVNLAAENIEAMTNKPQDNSIKALRQALQDVIDEALKTNNKNAFIFFIDDLDRLEPSVAVSILELIKNLFDLRNCIFVLAIDYGVVVKGLQSKFGKMTEENEWEFRAFFDKIIQLPFSMPISNYNIEKYLESILVNVNYFDKKDLENEEILKSIANIVSLSVGTNPRALKRLANSVSLIEIIRGNEKITSEDRVIEFALICIQIAYPLIYGFIQKKADFTSWDEQFVSEIVKSRKIDETELNAITDSTLFDETWEQNIWKLCQISSFLKQKVYQLSELLNLIKDNINIPENEDIEDVLNRLLSMSSVTSVSAESQSTGTKKEKIKIKQKVFESNMKIFIEQTLSVKFKLNFSIFSKYDRGSIYINCSNAKENYHLHVWTDYKRIKVFINDKSKDKAIRDITLKWFEENLKDKFPKMYRNGNKSRTHAYIILLDEPIKDSLGEQEILEEYKRVVEDVYNSYSSKVS